MRVKSKFNVSVCVFGLLLAVQAQAIPELRETRGDYNGDIVTIFPDHENRSVYYFMPNSSQFAKNGSLPAVGLTHWGLNSESVDDGGGVLSFVLRAGLSPDVKSELMRFKKIHPQSRLSVVPFARSYIVGPNADKWNDLIKSIDLPPAAGVAETEVGVNMLLTEQGARAFKALISGANTPFNVQLCFDVLGALPSMDAQITLRYTRIYEHFRAAASHRFLWFRWSVASEVEKLMTTGDISISILGGDAKFEDYIKDLTDQMIAQYMTPVLEAKPGSGGGGTWSFNYTRKEERNDFSGRVTKKAFVTDTRCLPLAFKDLKPWADKLITVAD